MSRSQDSTVQNILGHGFKSENEETQVGEQGLNSCEATIRESARMKIKANAIPRSDLSQGVRQDTVAIFLYRRKPCYLAYDNNRQEYSQ